NKNLINLKGLPPQTQMKDIHIINNDNFTGFQGLFSLIELRGELSIEGNPKLLNMAGLWNLKKMGGTFRLKEASVLDLEGLSSLQEVGNIRIEDSWIRSLNGMDQLKIIRQNLFLEDNPNLGNISALESIQSLGEESQSIILVEIDKNGISNCCPILDLRDTFPDDGIDPNQRFHVFDNGRNCTNFGTVVATCNPLTIINSQSGTPIQSLQKGDVLPNTPFATTTINIKAELGNVPPEGSVQFSLQGPLAQEQIENQAPYFLFGDEGGQILKSGFYVLQIRVYAEKNAQGERLSTQTLGFTREADNPAILGFQVRDADNDQVIQDLSSGDRIDLNQLSTSNLSIEALTAPDQIGSVLFQLQGPLSHDQTESVAPYALFGNDPFDFEDFRGRELPEGTYSLVATPYSQPRAKGESGAPLQIDFEVFRGQGIQIFPNPSAGPISIQSEQAGEVQIFDSQGILKIQDKLQVEEIKSLELAPGLYFLKWKSQGKIEEKKIIIK
ncbi:MAG: T9SS type A sorting domain-containing protein, partial [Bacteroidota bacterium]